MSFGSSEESIMRLDSPNIANELIMSMGKFLLKRQKVGDLINRLDYWLVTSHYPFRVVGS
ncbi:hypothetical protein JCM17380_47810 [Desulfosporosinus burensis]